MSGASGWTGFENFRLMVFGLVGSAYWLLVGNKGIQSQYKYSLIPYPKN